MEKGEVKEMNGLKAKLRRESSKLSLNFDELKSGGFIKQTQKDLFTVRLRCPGGKVTSSQLNKASEIADKYGRGEIHISVRQSIEVPYVSYEYFNELTESLRGADWSVASCGPRVRVPTACAGCAYNPNGLTDTQGVCAEIDRRFFGTPTGHHKFKVSLSGCPIDCFRTREMDLGFQGVMEPELVQELCNGCSLCVKGCEEKALRMEKGFPVRDYDKCISCGDCVKVCPSSAMVGKRTGWLVRVGGKHGKHPYHGYEVANFVTDEQVYSLVERTVDWYRKNGQGRERIGMTIERVGLNYYIDEVLVPLGLEVIRKPEERLKYYERGNTYSAGNVSGFDADPESDDLGINLSASTGGYQVPEGTLDLRGILCPTNFVHVKVHLEEMEIGQVLNVILDEGEAIRNVPRSVKEEGHCVTGVEKLPDNSYMVSIRKEAD